ncbi:stellacyanin [Brachypodium distachyon]|uniref:Phytocyanin domain-containing protein n=1 Tax=Brachypodium distachyon TaxID=15368 RepID=I1IHP6_BRADI|nr:stellacyanin [Brachypodium distachyon]KQJ86405.1 hypothetical protein BRADI_4g05250v3 [Brachypodium distachyon]|eukprot:XP_003575446.1 stellacyanin [Brachypodium distachyon]
MATRALLILAITAAALGTALGATYTVGAPAGSWDLRTNYAQWTSTVKFRAGDQLVFKYSPAAHNVVEVSKADYDACSNSSPLASFQTGNDVIPLPAAGSRYFICGVPGHCDGGMKIRVNVEAAASSTGALPPAVSPRAAAPAMAPVPSARAPASGGQAVPPSSSATTSTSAGSWGLGLAGVFAAGLMAFC